MKCSCGNPIGTLTTSCPKCGRTYIVKTVAIVLIFILLLGGFLGVMQMMYG